MSDDDSDEEMYSITSSQAVYKRSHSRASSVARESVRGPVPKLLVTSESDDRRPSNTYLPVAKWAIDYNNRNYVRSQCNKNKGQHRKAQGRPFDWQIRYDNSYHTRSKVNDPKGLHRKIPEVKRKYVPDKDDLADATGWEFDCGPEFDQEEHDVPFIPEGKIVTRGGYRWYGVVRNDSDCDVREKEHRENLLNEKLEAELKYGPEFFQSDRPHMAEQLDRRYSRGGYRFYEVPRNVYDIKPEEFANAGHDSEWRRKHHSNGVQYLDLEMANYDWDEDRDRHVTKGKPFKRTILNKVYELRKRNDSRGSVARRATRLSLVPGEGERTVYEGVPDRFHFGTKKSPSIRSVFKKKSERQKYRSSREGSEYEEYETQDTERRYNKLSPEYEATPRMADERRRTSRGMSSHYDEDEMRPRASGSRRSDEYSYSVKQENVANSSREQQENTYRERKPERAKREDTYKDYRHSPKDRNAANSSREQQEYTYRERKPERAKREEIYQDYHHSPKDRNAANSSREQQENTYRERKPERAKREEIYQDYRHSPKDRVFEKEKRRDDYVDRPSSWSSRSVRSQGLDVEEFSPEKDKVLKKLPPHVEQRVRDIRKKMESKLEQVDLKHRDKTKDFSLSGSEDSIDLMKHKSHPRDRGQTHNSEYEKYVTKNGSELWVKKEEKFAELHHKDPR